MRVGGPGRSLFDRRAACALALVGAAPLSACTTEFPARDERTQCATHDDCAADERCVEATPDDPRCWPASLACGGQACEDAAGGGPLIVPIGALDDAGHANPSGDAGPALAADEGAGGAGDPGGVAPPPDRADAGVTPEPGECPQAALLAECPVDNAGFCVYEPETRRLPIPCEAVCELIGLRCEGTSRDEGRLCEIATYARVCDVVGFGLACVCVE